MGTYLTRKELAAYINVSLPIVDKLRKMPDFPAITIGRKILFPAALVDQWMTDHADGRDIFDPKG